MRSNLLLLVLVGSWRGGKGVRLLLFLILYEELGDPLLLQGQGVLLGAGGLPLQRLLVLREFLLPVLLEVVMVDWVLGFDFFEHVQGPFDPIPSSVGGCWPPFVMPWHFLGGQKCTLVLLNNSGLFG